MRVTNRLGLPQTLVNAIERDPYSMGAARISVTGLLRPPRITLLHKKHAAEIESDVVDNIWSLFGRAVHKILEDGGDEEHLTEERLFFDARGWRVSGAVDLQRLGNGRVRVVDYKTCSAYAVMHEKPDWVSQLNLYAHALRVAKDADVESLAICAIIRDWSRHKAKADPDYPQDPVAMIELSLWSPEEAAAFAEQRVRVHQEAIASVALGEDLPLCSDEERWMRQPEYAVKKPGNKRATKVFDTFQKAKDFAAIKGLIIEERPAEPIHCTSYCNVSAWCSQYAAWKKERENGR